MPLLTDMSKMAVVELAVFVPVALLVPCILRGRGFHTTGSLSWFFLSILSVLRIIGAAVQLGVQSFDDASRTNQLLDAVSFAPLLLAFINLWQPL